MKLGYPPAFLHLLPLLLSPAFPGQMRLLPGLPPPSGCPCLGYPAGAGDEPQGLWVGGEGPLAPITVPGRAHR